MLIIAIDPGETGGIAWGRPNGYGGISCVKMPETLVERKDFISTIHDHAETTLCIIEDVGFHVAGNNAVASATFAAHCGELRGILVALEIPFTQVRPQTWQKSISGLPAWPKRKDYDNVDSYKTMRSKVKRERKRHIRNLMQQQYPKLHVTDATADALAILSYHLSQKGGPVHDVIPSST